MSGVGLAVSALTDRGDGVMQPPGETIADVSFDRYARLVRSALGVPTALVSIVEPARQIFPGAVGLPEPWQARRETPLSHSFCQHVVADAEPLVVTDARTDPRVAGNLAITELSVIAYAGFPLVDSTGAVIGALCAIDSRPRDWTQAQLAVLEDLAAACSTELVLRATRRRAEEAEVRARASADRARALLTLSEDLGRTVQVPDIALALQHAAQHALGAALAGLWVYDDTADLLRWVQHAELSWPQAERRRELPMLPGSSPAVDAALEGRMVLFGSEVERVAAYPRSASRDGELPLEATAYLPLLMAGEASGALAVVWREPRGFSPDDRALLQALSTYTGQAVQRARLLEQRTTTALVLQRAMLTELPTAGPLEIDARYLPAAADDLVGGDWYDALTLRDGSLAVTIGDVIGHNIDAAARMGALRSMLRSLAWDRDEPPSGIVQRLDDTLRGTRTATLASVVLGHFVPAPEPDSFCFEWTNGGHPPPLLVSAEGRARLLDGHRAEPPLGIVPGVRRSDQTVVLPPGATLVLYTDGLIERRDEDIDAGLARLVAVTERQAGKPLPDLLDTVIAELVDGRPVDDVAVVAVRVRHPDETDPTR
ncbi:MAG: SpoIIE family protein phosphatase [Jatrophihabitans sp.]|uniref:SpoIIE family protein phosphatase n=1 Tax=Jatrophihabitans sp. TaxID=1932789 RepID=UPI003F7FC815